MQSNASISKGKSGSDGAMEKDKTVPFSSDDSFGENLLRNCLSWNSRGSSTCRLETGFWTTLDWSTGGAIYRLAYCCGVSWSSEALAVEVDVPPTTDSCLSDDVSFSISDRVEPGPCWAFATFSLAGSWMNGQASPARQPR